MKRKFRYVFAAMCVSLAACSSMFESSGEKLQENFQLMQQRLSAHIGELEQLNTTLRERGEELQKAYSEAKKADRMKTAFLHNMTNQMQEPAEAIDRDVNAMLEGGADTADDIQNNSNRITELLNNLLNMSDEEKRTV